MALATKTSRYERSITGYIFFVFVFSSEISAASKPEEFFTSFTALSGNFDASVAEFYATEAKIHAYRKYPHGPEREMEFTGLQWRQLIQKVMPLAKAVNDKSTFSKVVIEPQGARYKITANRYSVRKRYTDTGYYMIIQPDGLEDYKITEEYMEPNC